MCVWLCVCVCVCVCVSVCECVWCVCGYGYGWCVLCVCSVCGVCVLPLLGSAGDLVVGLWEVCLESLFGSGLFVVRLAVTVEICLI